MEPATVLRCGVSVAAVAGVTGVCRLAPVNASTAGFAYLLAVLAIASTWGIVEAVAASVAGMLCFNFFFLPPFGTLTIADPQNYVALCAFLVTAIVASQLSNRAKRQAEAALTRQRELERLYDLGRRILLDQGEGPLPQRLARNVADSFEMRAVALYHVLTAEEYRGGPEDLTIPPAILSAALSGEIESRCDAVDARVALIRLGGQAAGVLALRGQVRDTTVDAISNLVAIGLERARAQEAENRAQAARKSEELKSTLLDAVAHEFKTPLTSIKAAVTTVLDRHTDGSEADRDLLSIIDEEADRLNGLVTDAIETSRIEGGHFRLSRAGVAPADLLSTVVKQMGSRLQDRSVEVHVRAGTPEVSLDPELIQLALRQLIDNAVKYSPPDSPIRVSADVRNGNVVLGVEDEGPGIRPADAELIFDRFYRASPQRHGIPGSGLGLAVVRRIARAHGGDAVLHGGRTRGARFELVLPLEQELVS